MRRNVALKQCVPSQFVLFLSSFKFSSSHLSFHFLFSCLLHFAFLHFLALSFLIRLAFLFLSSLVPPMHQSPPFATARRIQYEPSLTFSRVFTTPIELMPARWAWLARGAVPVAIVLH